jgi:hypothetical protein
LGALLVLSFLATRNNPNVTLGDLGVFTLLLGVLVMTSDVLGTGRVAHPDSARPSFTLSGWLVFSAGLLIVLAAFVLENQVSCSCPAFGPCDCGEALYGLGLDGGALVAAFGVVVIVVGRMYQANRQELRLLSATAGIRTPKGNEILNSVNTNTLKIPRFRPNRSKTSWMGKKCGRRDSNPRNRLFPLGNGKPVS